MNITKVSVHNFRSIKAISFELDKYMCIVGPNNSGKSNLVNALRIFYDDAKYNETIDFPKFNIDDDDNESWIEIEYKLSDDEFNTLKDDYKGQNNVLKVRKYLKSNQKDKVKNNQSNIYAYENGNLSNNLFYGAKNISEAKLGNIIYIPELTTTDENLKLTGPSPLREIISFVMNKVVKNSSSFNNLTESFKEFNEKFRNEASNDGYSLEELRKDINESLKEWEIEFKLDINSVKPEDIIKNLVSHYTIDKNLNKEIEIKYLGQGLQRHIIYTLLKLSSKYKDIKKSEKKDFSPDFTLILFEEPEAFLHPNQQELLNYSLRDLSFEEGQQVIITTHSPIFVSKNIEEINSIIKFKREEGKTQCYQITNQLKSNLFSENNNLIKRLEQKKDDNNIDDNTKKRIIELIGDTYYKQRLEEESIRYLLWLDSERCSAFFADIVLICEGATEKVFIDYLIKNKWNELKEKRIYVLDAMGKFNIHRYMNLFNHLGIYHSVLADKDENKNIHEIINEFITKNKNNFTIKIDFFDKDIESFLGIEPPERKDKKPLCIMWNYFNQEISEDKIETLKSKIENLVTQEEGTWTDKT
ncbi:MAG: AAA family ATPase [bacterium]|nr:AAA family ATPase [bacterium]